MPDEPIEIPVGAGGSQPIRILVGAAHSHPGTNVASVPVPAWTGKLVLPIVTAVILALGAWVVRTWDAPGRIVALESEVRSLQQERANEKLQSLSDLSTIRQDVALIQKDVKSISEGMVFLRDRTQ